MSILNSWGFYLIGYLILAVTFNQFFKISTKTSKKDGALIVTFQLLGGLSILVLAPFFEYKFPTEINTYICLFIAIIFYSISDRIGTTARRGIEASTYSILKQLSTVFMIVAGLVFFKEEFVLSKITGALIIVLSNIIIFYDKSKTKFNKFVWLGVLSNAVLAVALFLDVSISDNFNLPIYVALTLIVPALIIMVFDRIKLSDIKAEIVEGNKTAIMTTGLSWGIMILCMLRAYQLGKVTVVSPLCSLTVMLNVIIGYIFLKEKQNMLKKYVCALLIILSIVLIKLG